MEQTTYRRRRTREDRLAAKHKGQLLCEWCNKYTPVDPTLFMMNDHRLRDKTRWSEYTLKDWKHYKTLFTYGYKEFYCMRPACVHARDELLEVATLTPNKKPRRFRRQNKVSS